MITCTISRCHDGWYALLKDGSEVVATFSGPSPGAVLAAVFDYLAQRADADSSHSDTTQQDHEEVAP